MQTMSNVAATPAPSSWRTRTLRWLKILALTYLGVILVLLLFENYLVYHPTTASAEWLPPPVPEVKDVSLTTAGGTKIHGWWYPRAGADGALLYLHGNAGNLSHRRAVVLELRERLNVPVLIIDYPGYGKSEGRPTEAGCYAAADAAHDWLTREQRVAPEKLILLGKSLGGGVAVDLASRRDHRALVLVKTFTTLPDVGARLYPFLPVRWLMRNRFDSVSKIGRCRRPVFVAHGTADTLIPFALGKRLYDAANEPKRFLSLAGVDHNDALPVTFFTELTKFLKETEKAAVP